MSGAVEHGTEDQQLLDKWVGLHGAVVAHRSAEAAQNGQEQNEAKHFPARQGEKDQAGDR